jgi:hypothetical protein
LNQNNIIFGAPFDEVRYKKVLYQCSLERDLELFDAGDATEVGEKGLTLSGGQKARVTLARAIYSSAEIILLDDVLAALESVFPGVLVIRSLTERQRPYFQMDHREMFRRRPCSRQNSPSRCMCALPSPCYWLFKLHQQTHNVAMTRFIARFVVTMSPDGSVASQIHIADTPAKELVMEIVGPEDLGVNPEYVSAVQATPEVKKSEGKLIAAEEVDIGHVSWAACRSNILLHH